MRTYRTHEEYLNEVLQDPKEAALYLNAALEENDAPLLLVALAQVAQAHGMSKTAKKASMSRAGVYKSLSKNGNPEFKTFLNLLKASGLRMSFKPA
ncbi:MAG: addiction module antidote protein [Elusimicrobiota bacterium]